MGDAKPGIVMANRDRELLIPVAHSGEDDHDSTPKPSSSSSSSSHHSGQEVLTMSRPKPIEEMVKQFKIHHTNSHLFKIDNISLFKKRGIERVDSSVFDLAGHKWKLEVYPYGDAIFNAKGSHVSIYLLNQSPVDDKPKYELFVVSQLEKKSHSKGQKTYYGPCGEAHLISLADLELNGYLIGDCCMFGVKFHGIEPAKSGTAECISLIEKPLNHKVTWMMTKFSSFDPRNFLQSNDFVVGNRKWRIKVHPRGCLCIYRQKGLSTMHQRQVLTRCSSCGYWIKLAGIMLRKQIRLGLVQNLMTTMALRISCLLENLVNLIW